MARRALSCAVILIGLGVSPATAAQDTSERLTVGTWNLEWLGTPSMRSDGPRSPEDLATIAAVIADIVDLEVMVLAEINVASDEWRMLRDQLGSRGFRFVSGTAEEQTIVLAYDADEVTLVSAAEPELDIPTAYQRPDPAGGTCRTAGAKRPVIATLRAGRFDVTVVGVHLKSGWRPEGCSDETFTSWVRGQQSHRLLQALQARQSAGEADGDVIIVGDFNGGFTDGATSTMRQAGYRILTAPGNRAASSDTLSYRKGEYHSALDHLAIPGGTEREWVPGTTMYFPLLSRLTREELAAYHRRFSDHALAWSEFRTDLPDDD